jgi:hypothetical protein
VLSPPVRRRCCTRRSRQRGTGLRRSRRNRLASPARSPGTRAAPRWTGPSTPSRRDQHPPHCHHRVRGRVRGWQQGRRLSRLRWLGLTPICRNPSCLPAVRHVGRRCVPLKSCASLVRSPAGLAVARSATRPPANRIRRGPRSTGHIARCNRALGVLAASAAAARRPDSTRTGRGDNVRPTLPPAQYQEATETYTEPQHRHEHRHPPRKQERGVPPPA